MVVQDEPNAWWRHLSRRPHELWVKRQEQIAQTRASLPGIPARNRTVSSLRRMVWHWYVPVISTILVLGFLSIYAAVTYFMFLRDLTSPEKIMNRNNRGLILYDTEGKPFYRSSEAKEFRPVPLSDIPEVVRKATLAAEDAQFYTHPGFSYRSIVRSLFKNLSERKLTRYGGSTITQQLVKNSLVGQEQTLNRKFKELVLAVEIERRYNKDQILEMYLNSVYYGSNAYGVAEAAQRYLGKDIRRVNLAEASFLAALPNAPSYLSPHTGSMDAAKSRQSYVLQQMTVHSMISASEAERARQVQLAVVPRKADGGSSPHFALFVRDNVYELFEEDEANRRGFRVYTTFDSRLQKIAEEEVSRQVKLLARFKASNAALVALDPKTGALLAMVGSADWENDAIGGKFNAAIQAKRQPGSAIKPLVYLAALADRTVSTVSTLHDKPTDFGGGYRPKNYDGKFRGDVTVRRALANSLNVPSVELLNMVGVPRAIEVAQALGITTLEDPSRYGLSLVLGGGEVRLFELTAAYGVIANNGLKAETYAIERIEDKFGNTVYTHQEGVYGLLAPAGPRQTVREVLDAGPTYLVTHILADSAARAEVFGNALTIGRQAAVKTGTTDDFRDSWTIGYTPQLVVGVWIGNSDNTPMTGVAGSLGAAPIWRAVMERGLAGKPVQSFTRPAGVAEVKICLDKKLLDENGVPEVYLYGTEPTERCNPEPSPSPTTEPSPTPEFTPPLEPSPEPTPTPPTT